MRLLIIILCILPLWIQAQQILDFDSYRKRVLNYHPIMQKASNVGAIGDAEIQKARGQFDPVFQSEVQAKQFDGKEYYNLSNTGLKIPTWTGIDFKAGYEQNRGYYVNDEVATPASGLWYAGVSIPLGQGLLFDERRASLQSAKVFENASENQRLLMINDLMLDACAAYWNWYQAYQKLVISNEGLRFSFERFEGVKANALAGDSPMIDTVEASIQLGYRQLDQLQADADFKNAGLMLNLFLWSEDLVPLELDTTTRPQSSVSALFKPDQIRLRLNNNLPDSIPMLLQAAYKLEQLEIETRLKREMLKPKVQLNYNPLAQPSGEQLIPAFSSNQYKYGFSVYIPLLLRKERGALTQAKLKQENAELDLRFKTAELKAKEGELRNDLLRLYNQLDVQRQQVALTLELRNSEQINFEAGESSLFLVNSREISYLGSAAKLAELEAKLKISEAKWLWLIGEL